MPTPKRPAKRAPAKSPKKSPAVRKAAPKKNARPVKKAPAKATRKKTPAPKKTPTKAAARKPAPSKPRKAPAKRAPKKATAAAPPAHPQTLMPRIQPMLAVPDVAAHIRFLEVLGFQTTLTLPGADGQILHAVLNLGDAVLHLDPLEIPGKPMDARMEADRQGPRGRGVSLYVMVPDVQAVYETLQRLGAPIVDPPRDQFWGDRTTAATDPAGYLWCFAQHVKDMTPDEMAAALADTTRSPP